MPGAARRYYDLNAEVILEALGRPYTSALVSRAETLQACLSEDLEYIVQAAALADGQTVLEAGAGNGLFGARLLQRLPGLRYRGVELSSSQVAIARRLVPQAEFLQASYDAVDLAPASLDRVLFLETIGYCTEFDRLLERLAMALRPDGKVFIKNPGQYIADYGDFLLHSRYFDPVRREYGFDDESLGIVPDIDFIIRKFELHGFRLERHEHPFYNEYFYNAAFYAPGVARPAARPEKNSIAFDWSGFDPERSLSPLGRRHPRYVEYHQRSSAGTGHLPRNRLTGCVILVFAPAAAPAGNG
jgi:cyclopropane fatty-acyl-phospholipid synthase-like methyltransferase